METLKTDRLLLRPLSVLDINEVFFLRSDEVVGQYIKREKLKDTDGALLFINRICSEVAESKIYYWAISSGDSNKMIGSICLWNFNEAKTKAELGYDLHPDYQGQGIMNETIQCILQFGINSLKLAEISAYTDHRNTASCKLLKRNGFVLQDELRDEGNENNRIFILTPPTR